jgi:hypothetical protein
MRVEPSVETKECLRCGESSPLSVYGINRYCSVCQPAYDKERYAENKHKILAKHRETYKIDSLTPEFKARSNKNTKASYERNPEKQKCRAKARDAVNKGVIVKETCFLCGEENVQIHHPDYTQPLAIIWLCQLHHTQYHMMERKVAAIMGQSDSTQQAQMRDKIKGLPTSDKQENLSYNDAIDDVLAIIEEEK